MPRSTFHKRVEEGKIIPMKGMRGFYKLNDSLPRLGLREVREPPKPVATRSMEDLVRLAYRIGKRGRLEGSDLIVWLKLETDGSFQVRLVPTP